MNGNDRAITRFTMVAHSLFHMYELSIPVLVVVWLDDFGTTPAVLGLIVGVGYALVGFGALPSGVISDYYRSRSLVLVALLGMGLGFTIATFATTLRGVAVALVMWGAAASIYHPTALALLSRGVEDRGRAFAYHGAAGNVGTVFGPTATAIGLTVFEWRTVTAALVLPALVGVALSWCVDFDETARVSDDAESVEGDSASPGIDSFGSLARLTNGLLTGGFVLLFAVIICYGLFYRGVFTFLPDILGGLAVFDSVDIGGWTIAPAHYVYASLLLVGVAGQYAGGRLINAYDTVRLLGSSFAVLATVSLLFIPASTSGLLPILVVCGLLGFFVYVIAPIYQAAIADSVSTDIRGFSYGVAYLGMFGIGAFGTVLAGWVLTWAKPATLFGLLASLALIAAFLTVALWRVFPSAR